MKRRTTKKDKFQFLDVELNPNFSRRQVRLFLHVLSVQCCTVSAKEGDNRSGLFWSKSPYRPRERSCSWIHCTFAQMLQSDQIMVAWY